MNQISRIFAFASTALSRRRAYVSLVKAAKGPRDGLPHKIGDGTWVRLYRDVQPSAEIRRSRADDIAMRKRGPGGADKRQRLARASERRGLRRGVQRRSAASERARRSRARRAGAASAARRGAEGRRNADRGRFARTLVRTRANPQKIRPPRIGEPPRERYLIRTERRRLPCARSTPFATISPFSTTGKTATAL